MIKTWTFAKQAYLQSLTSGTLHSTINSDQGSVVCEGKMDTEISVQGDEGTIWRDFAFINTSMCFVAIQDIIFPPAPLFELVYLWNDEWISEKPDFPLYLSPNAKLECRLGLKKNAPLGTHRGCVIAFVRFCPPLAHQSALNMTLKWSADNLSMESCEPLIGIGNVFETLIVERKTDMSDMSLDPNSNIFIPKQLREMFDSHVPTTTCIHPPSPKLPPIPVVASNRDHPDVQHWINALNHEVDQLEKEKTAFDMFNTRMMYLDDMWKCVRCLLEVPGLPEARPGVNYGDRLLIRSGEKIVLQFEAYVVSVSKTNVAVIMDTTARCLFRRGSFSLPVHVRFDGFCHDSFDEQAVAVKNVLNSRHRPALSALEGDVPHVTPTPLSHTKFTTDTTMHMSDEQCDACSFMVNDLCSSHIITVTGGAGTGKTMVVVEAVTRCARAKQRVLLTAPSPTAVDVLCQRLAPHFNAHDMVLVLPHQRMEDTVPRDIRKYTNKSDFCGISLYVPPSQDAIMDASIVLCTCNTAAYLQHYKGLKFHRIFIEEAGQATVPESLIPIQFADRATSVFLIGDDKQLPPLVHSGHARQMGLEVSLIAKLIFDNVALSTRLTKNFRSHAALIEFPSKQFYNGHLEAAADQNDGEMLAHGWDELQKEIPLLFYGVKSTHYRFGEAMSYYNPTEVQHVGRLVDSLLKSDKLDIKASEIGCVSPFRQQVYRLRELLRARGYGDVRVGTVDDLQGQEHRVLICSGTIGRNIRPSSAINQLLRESRLFSPNRFNVMLTRAISLLVVVGDPQALAADKNWKSFIDHTIANDCYTGVDTDYDSEADDILIDKLTTIMLGAGKYDSIYPSDIADYYVDDMDEPFRISL